MCKRVKSASACYTLTSCVLTWRCCLGSMLRSWSPGCLSSPHWWCLRLGCCPGRRRNPRTRWARRPSCCKNHSSFVALHSTRGCCLLTDENIKVTKEAKTHRMHELTSWIFCWHRGNQVMVDFLIFGNWIWGEGKIAVCCKLFKQLETR